MMNREQIRKDLELHRKYLNFDPSGVQLNWCDKNFSRSNLGGTNLSSADLSGADLSGSDFSGAKFINARLCNANFHRSSLSEAEFRNADLRGANFRGTDLQHAKFCGANLNGAIFSYADLYDADLRGADLRGADLSGADIDFSCWPLQCNSFDVKVDKRIATQLAYHFCRLNCDDGEYKKVRNDLVDFANQFHRVDECGKLTREDLGVKCLWRFEWESDYGHLTGLFKATKQEVEGLIGKEVSFVEIEGKYSEVSGTIKNGEITLESDNPVVIDAIKPIGLNPLDYVAEE